MGVVELGNDFVQLHQVRWRHRSQNAKAKSKWTAKRMILFRVQAAKVYAHTRARTGERPSWWKRRGSFLLEPLPKRSGTTKSVCLPTDCLLKTRLAVGGFP